VTEVITDPPPGLSVENRVEGSLRIGYLTEHRD
jgi:hypothetical protein